MKKGFTLSEVLITLGIIGVVAALTMPTLIANHKKKVVVTRLRKFYTTMSQALLQWQNDNGCTEIDCEFPVDTIRNGEKSLKWFNENLGKYINSTSNNYESICFKTAFNDGSGYAAYINESTRMLIFFCIEYKYCSCESFDGNKTFLFDLYRGKLYTSLNSMKSWDRETILDSCKYGNHDNPEESIRNKRHACTRLIEYDGWEIKGDYPWKQIMLEK